MVNRAAETWVIQNNFHNIHCILFIKCFSYCIEPTFISQYSTTEYSMTVVGFEEYKK